MRVQVTLTTLCLLFRAILAKTSMIELTRNWKSNFGWEVVCSWKLYSNDTLQSVRLYRSDQQFLVYRPETDGPKRSMLFKPPNMYIQADCSDTDSAGGTGQCVVSIELLQPVTEDIRYMCEVSGERPQFRTEAKTIIIEAFVPPSNAVVELIPEKEQNSGRVNVNCTSSGMPAPTLVWTIGDQKIPADFSDGVWDFNSKLYHVWASLSYTLNGVHVVCTPETKKSGQLVRGQSAQYNGSQAVRGGVTIGACLLLILALTT